MEVKSFVFAVIIGRKSQLYWTYKRYRAILSTFEKAKRKSNTKVDTVPTENEGTFRLFHSIEANLFPL